MEETIGTPFSLAAGEKLRPWTSHRWLAYYVHNSDTLRQVPWERGAELTPEEREAIASSVQAFQLGEGSEGRHLQQAAEAWGRAHDDPDYPETIRLFIKEEQRHSAELGRFMEMNAIPPIQKAWTDSMFRYVRRLAGLDLSIMVLLTAEIVAQVYYVALREATGSTVLRAICDQILRDEEEHVRFQCERLAMSARGYGWLRLMLRYIFQRLLMLATLPIVWSGHRRAYRAGGYTFGAFASETWLAFSRAVPKMHPRSYDWGERRTARQRVLD